LTHDSEPRQNAIARYLWNVDLCEALYPILHLFEVSLRNAMDWSLKERVGPNWLEGSHILLDNERQKVSEAAEALRGRGDDLLMTDLSPN
jgi:hypothetical protein